MSEVTCMMYCPKCQKGYKIDNLQIQFFYVMVECKECNEEGKFIFKEEIL